jgi:hypothetical protein
MKGDTNPLGILQLGQPGKLTYALTQPPNLKFK